MVMLRLRKQFGIKILFVQADALGRYKLWSSLSYTPACIEPIVPMAYNNFTLETVKHQFGLNLIDSPFCESLPPADPQPEFLTIFRQWLPLAQRAKSEKAKSELLVSPILTEVSRLAADQVQLFSGEEFNVDRERGLNGFCDFLLSRSTAPYVI
jgi:hypothetical protein